MSFTKTALSLILGSTIAVTLSSAPALASTNPFASPSPGKAFLVAEADNAKCGDMKADAVKADATKAASEKCDDMKAEAAKTGDSKCGDMKDMRKKVKERHKKHMKKMMDKEGKCGSGAMETNDKKDKDSTVKPEEKKCGSM